LRRFLLREHVNEFGPINAPKGTLIALPAYLDFKRIEATIRTER
jgi:hypothetical protein